MQKRLENFRPRSYTARVRNVTDREIRAKLREFMEFAPRTSIFRLSAEVPHDRLLAIVQGDGMTHDERAAITQHAYIATREIKSDWLAWSVIITVQCVMMAAFAIAWVFRLPAKLFR